MTGGFWGADADPEAPGDGRSDGVDDAELLVRLAAFAALPSA